MSTLLRIAPRVALALASMIVGLLVPTSAEAFHCLKCYNNGAGSTGCSWSCSGGNQFGYTDCWPGCQCTGAFNPIEGMHLRCDSWCIEASVCTS